jgi:hypothetical protein
MPNSANGYTVILYEVHNDLTKSVAVISECLNARDSLKEFRAFCEIGRFNKSDGKWFSWQAERRHVVQTQT